jgi:hypothetical protein
LNGSIEQACRAVYRPACAGLACGWSGRLPLGVLLSVAAVACLAGCRSQAPRSRSISALRLTDREGYIEVVARQREREQKSKVGVRDSRVKETIFEENLRLDTEGYVYHPNLLEFTLGGLFGLVQEDYEDTVGSQSRSSSDSGTVYEFDFEARFLKRKKFPLTVFAHRRRGLNPRPFLPSLETTTTEYGVTWQYVSGKTPTMIQFRDSDTRMTPRFVGGEQAEDGRQKSTLLRFETAYVFSERNILSLTYEHESIEETPFERDYDSDEVTLTHRLDFGERYQHRLDSELNYLDQRGTPYNERTRWREILRLKHSETLYSRFDFEALDRTRGQRTSDIAGIEERSIYFSGLVQHELYESLSSQLTAFVQTQDFEPGLEIERFGVHARFDYRKTNRWGVLHAGYRVGIERADHHGETQAVDVLDEAHTFQDPDPITLNRQNINIGSIAIRAEDGVTLYRLGRDYRVRDLLNRVEIERIPTGWIADGETVLIDYVFNMGGTFELDTVTQNFAIRQNFDFGLRPYYRLEWQDQTISATGVVGVVPEDITAHIFGVEFEKSSLRLMAEYEDHDSTLIPFKTIRLGGSYSHRFKSGATGSIDARWTDTEHLPPDERKTRLFTLRGRYRHPITAALKVEGSVLYRNGEDTLSGDSEGIDVFLSLDWLIRETEINVTFELGQFEDDYAWEDSSALYVRVRRSF